MVYEGSRTQTGIEIYNASSSKSKKNTKAPTNEEGVTWVSSAGTTYTAPEITADIINDMYDNVYIRKLIADRLNLVFQKEFTVEVMDAKGNIDKELSLNLLRMCQTEGVDVWDNMKIATIEQFLFGLPIYNPVWGQDVNLNNQNETRLLKLRHLPSYSFKTAPSGQSDIYSPIMQGVIVDEKGEIQYWQEPEPGKTPDKPLTNAFSVRNPIDRGLAGDPIIVPLVPIIGMIQFLWNTVMVQANRIGSKILFIKITNPQAASIRNGNVSDVEYANSIIANWQSGVGYILRENFDIVEFNQKDDSNSLETLRVLKELIRDYVSPASLLGGDGGQRIGGNDNAAHELVDNYIIGIHNWLAKGFKHPILTNYLMFNKYEGYTAEFIIPSPMHDTREMDMKRAQTLFMIQSGKQNEMRGLLGQPILDEAQLKVLKEYYDSLSQTETLIRPPR